MHKYYTTSRVAFKALIHNSEDAFRVQTQPSDSTHYHLWLLLDLILDLHAQENSAILVVVVVVVP